MSNLDPTEEQRHIQDGIIMTRITWRLDLRWGLMLVRCIDTPNEADVLIVQAFGIGYSKWFGWCLGYKQDVI